MVDVMEDQPAFKAQLMTFGDSNPADIAKDSWIMAHRLMDRVDNNQSLCPELDLRSALEKLLKSFWFLKEHREIIAKTMHDIGINLIQNYQCEFKYNGEHYYSDCPNILLHQDYGFSLRAFEKYSCSICNKDPVDCDHRTGNRYNNIECIAYEGRCSVCGYEIDTCEHSLGEIYNDVTAIKIVSDLEIITFDLVKEPEFVFSRILEIPYSKNYILDGLANDPNINDFVYGESVVDCHHCATCKGYDPNANEALFSKNI